MYEYGMYEYGMYEYSMSKMSNYGFFKTLLFLAVKLMTLLTVSSMSYLP